MSRKNLFNLFVIVLYIGSCIIIYNQKPNYNDISSNNQIKEKVSKLVNINTNNNPLNDNIIKQINNIGNLSIEKINLNKNIYPINSEENDVSKNVTILNDTENLIVLAAHSGTGSIAYFNNLEKLEINDTIKLNYKNKNYTYKIKKIEEQEKNGSIKIAKKDTKILVLTTCSKKNKNKQLVIISEII